MEDIKRQLEEHYKHDERLFGEIFAALKLIRENDLHHMERSMTNMEALMHKFAEKMDGFGDKVDQNTKEAVENKTNIVWVKWIVMAFGGAVVVQIVALIFQK